MIYPESFEHKIGFQRIRDIVSGYCLYEPGKQQIMDLAFSADYESILLRLRQVEEFRQIILKGTEFPLEHFIDISSSLKKARIEGSWLEEQEVFNIRKCLDSVRAIIHFLKKDEEDMYPRLKQLSAELNLFPVLSDRISAILNKQGRLKDNASKELQEIRREMAGKESAISKKLNQILQKARQQGIVDEDASLAIRNGRPVIPVAASFKRQIAGYIHDESATGKRLTSNRWKW